MLQPMAYCAALLMMRGANLVAGRPGRARRGVARRRKMVAIGLMNPSMKKKKLKTGQRKDFPPIKLDLATGDKPKRKRGSARV